MKYILLVFYRFNINSSNLQVLLSYKSILHFFFCENLEDFNEAHLHEATVDIHMPTWIFSRLSIASVDDKQHLSEIVLSALVGYHSKENDWTTGAAHLIQLFWLYRLISG